MSDTTKDIPSLENCASRILFILFSSILPFSMDCLVHRSGTGARGLTRGVSLRFVHLGWALVSEMVCRTVKWGVLPLRPTKVHFLCTGGVGVAAGEGRLSCGLFRGSRAGWRTIGLVLETEKLFFDVLYMCPTQGPRQCLQRSHRSGSVSMQQELLVARLVWSSVVSGGCDQV